MVTKDRAFLFESVIQARMRRLAPLGSLSRLRAGLLHMTFQNPICATLESQRASEGNFRIQLGPFGWEKNRKIPYAIPLPQGGREQRERESAARGHAAFCAASSPA